MRAGDVLLFHRRDFSLMTSLIHLTTGSRWNHAAIAVGPETYAEATSEGVVISRLGTSPDEVRIVPITYDDEDDRLTAVAWAVARVGVRYGYLNAFMCGLNNVLVGLGFVVKRTDSIICSELVAEAMERAGIDFGKDSSLVSPGDLAEFLGVER